MKTFLPSLNRKLVAFFTIVLLLLLSSKTNAATINVTSSTTWSALGTTPTAADDIVISNQATLTVNVSNAVCKSITLGNGGSNNNGNLTFNASSQVTISGNIIFAPIGNRTNTLTMTAGGNLICQGITINEPSSSFVSGAGTVTLTANNTLPTTIFTTFNNLSITGGTTTIGVGTTVSGNLVVGTGAAFATTGTLTLGVTGTTSITGTFTLAGTGNKSFTGDVTLNSGAVWNETGVSAYSFAGTFANSATTFTANTGVHTFSGATKAFNGSTTTSIPSVAVTGTYTNNGTLTVGTALSGAGTLANASVLNTSGTVSTTTLSNSGTMNHSGSGTITTALANFTNTGTLNISGSGTITGITNNAAGIVNHSGSSTITSFNNATSTSTLTISTTPTVPTITTLTVTAAGNTVNYTGSGNQTVINAAYKNLGLSGSGVKTLSGTVTIATNLSISGTATASLNTGTTYTVGTLKLGGYGKNSGTWGSTSSAASNQTNTYFAATTGIVSVTTDSRPVVTVTASAQSKTYGGTAPTSGTLGTNFTVSGLILGDTASGATLGYSGSPAGNLATANVGGYTITPSALTLSPGSTSNYNISYSTGTLTVNGASLTITANNGSKTYGQTFTVGAGSAAFTSSALQNGETIGTITIASTGAVNTAAVGSYTIVPSAATGGTFTASNYSITYTNGTLTVGQASLTVTANNGTKVYGVTQATPVTGATTFGSTGLQNGETIGSVTLTYGSGAIAATDAVGSTSTITPSAATGGTFVASNYSISYTSNSGTLTVTVAPLTITAINGSKTYGQTYTVGSGSTAFTPTGLQNGETIGSITIASTGAVNTAAVGSYNIVPSAATGGTFTASNYSITYTNGTLTVGQASLTITANNGTKVYGTTQSTPVIGATTFGSTGLQNGETIGSVTLTYGSGALAATDAVGSTSTITPSAATGGTFTAGNYSISYTPNSGTLTVTAASLTITANNGTKVYGTTQATPLTGATTFGSTGLQNGETIGSVTLIYGSGAIAATDAVGSTSTITPSAATGGTFTASNYNIIYASNSGTLTVTAAPLTITADDVSKCFGTTYTLGTTAFGSTGLKNSETIDSVTLNSSGAISSASVGSYTIVPSAATGGTFTASNYSITYVNGTLTVNALPTAPTGTDGATCSTGTVNLSATVGGGETVDWYDAATGGTLLLSGSTAYTTPSISSTTLYYAEARNATTGCVSATRTTVTATVDPTSVGGAVSSDQTICSGTQPANLTLAGNTGSVVKWQSSSDVGFSSPTDISNTSTTLLGTTIGNLTASTYFRAVVQSGVCSTANSTPVLITVDAVSVGGTVSSAQTICYGTEPSNLTLTGYTGSVVKWQSSSDAGFSSPSDITETSTTLDGSTIGSLTANTYFRAVVQNGVCSTANSASVLITVSPTSVGGTVSSIQTICSGSQPADLTLSGQTGSVIKWESSLDAGFSSPTDIIVTSTTLTGATIGALTQDTYFRAVVQSGACDFIESASVLITVSASSAGGAVTGGTAICAGSTSGLLTLSGYTGSIVRWEYSVGPSFSSWTTIANTINTYTSGALTQTTQFRAVVQSGACAEVASTPTSVDINKA
uniref:beta strand repeat-containing protein n=1 Tax=Flavobacterium sp. TaxID=239 RepID=UPI002FDB029F